MLQAVISQVLVDRLGCIQRDAGIELLFFGEHAKLVEQVEFLTPLALFVQQVDAELGHLLPDLLAGFLSALGLELLQI